MSRLSRLFAAGSALLLAGCASEPTAPASRPTLTAPTSASADGSVDPNPDGTCRSGYSVTNGRCAPII
jgi:uncharacterized lipoprotein YmbA